MRNYLFYASIYLVAFGAAWVVIGEGIHHLSTRVLGDADYDHWPGVGWLAMAVGVALLVTTLETS